ncbi:MAG: hypothetical protein LBC19_09960 [Tannerella sp.]|jgi:hypothetical protein|nr:hypothetical protein [Tannerella sp.]
MTRKKKKIQPQRALVKHDSKTYLDKTYATVRKILQAYGFAPDLLDSFTKQQRRFLMLLEAEPPRFKVEEGHRVPRRLLDFVAESTHHFMRTHYIGDKRLGLTYLELATFGMAFSMILCEYSRRIFPPEQMRIIDALAEFFDNNRILNELTALGKHIRMTVMMISKVNFRIYGYSWKIYSEYEGNRSVIKSTVYISSEEPKFIRFTHKQKERKAFRVRAGRVIDAPPYDAVIDRWFIFHREESPSVYLDIYIQSHALQRTKERMDIFPAHKRNYYIMEPLLYMHCIEKSPSGRSMLTCYTSNSNTHVRLGYFPFIIQGRKLIVLTFLPLISAETPEGEFLGRTLGLQTDDMIFLGMDKLSFFCTVDFEQIPVLKEALIAANVWNLVEYATSHPDVTFTVDQKKTLMVKKFFEQKIDIDSRASDIDETDILM